MTTLEGLERQQWQSWFEKPIPMLQNQSPREAAQTAAGRKLVDKLLAFYDQSRSGMMESSFEFAAEEEVLNGSDNKRPTERKQAHAKKLEEQKATIFIPARCEVVGCDKNGLDVTRCGRCHCAYYCGKEHQSQDWARHKLDCKTIQKLNVELRPRSFLSSRELEKYPLGCFPLVPIRTEEKQKCFICHSDSSEVDVTFTECCNLPVCDNSHEYEMMSYSRDYCERSHSLYTKCDFHMTEEHEGNDWRDCGKCNSLTHGARPFGSTNRFCVTPCLEKFLPQGSMLTYGCDTPGCTSRFLPGHTGPAIMSNGQNLCSRCAA